MADKLSHNPFAAAAKEMKKDLQARETERQAREREAKAAARAARAAPPPPPPPEDEDALFRRHMSGVSRLEGGAEVPPETGGEGRVLPPAVDEDAEAMASLADLVSGQGEFDIADSDEYIEGLAHGLDRRLLKKLRRGFFSIQAHLDLHHRTRAEAKELVVKFIATSRMERRRCVLIVHGRGLNSKDQIPVLKEALRVWLGRGRIGRQVLAFCTALPTDGGAGAVYVLLRK